MLLRWISLFGVLLVGSLHAIRAQAPNILYIISDDLNDYVWEGDNRSMDMPNLAALAAEGTRFDACQASSPLCCPSRVSFLTGKGSAWTGVTNNQYVKYFRKHFGTRTVVTLMEHFRENGYFTVGLNKVFHNFNKSKFDNDLDATETNPLLREQSWNEYYKFKDGNPTILDVQDLPGTGYRFGRYDDADENMLADVRAVNSAISVMDRFVNNPGDFAGRPLMLTVGLVKPHTPHLVPARFYPPQYIPDPLSATAINYKTEANPGGWPMPNFGPDGAHAVRADLPEAAKRMAAQNGNHQAGIDAWAIANDAASPLSATELRGILMANANMAYWATSRFVDEQVGRLLDALDSLGLADNTIVVFHSDHGFSQGEHTHWAKNSQWETDTRVPLIIREPGGSAPQRVHEPVSLLDIFPTLCQMAGLPLPVVDGDPDFLDGRALLPLKPSHRSVHHTIGLRGDNTLACGNSQGVYEGDWHMVEIPFDPTAQCDSFSLIPLLYNLAEDPYEWDNQAGNALTKPIQDFLSDRLNDLKPVDRWRVVLGGADQDTVTTETALSLTASLRDTEDMLQALPAGTEFIWQLSLQPNILVSGATANLDLSLIPPAALLAKKQIRVQLFWRDIASGEILGFATRSLWIVAPSTPVLAKSTDATDRPSAEGQCKRSGAFDLLGRPLVNPNPGEPWVDACGQVRIPLQAFR